MCCYQSDVTRVTSSLALVKISRKNMPTWNSAGIFNWDSNWCQFCWMKFEAWHVFSGLETANSLMVRCGRGVRRPSTQVVTVEGLQKCAKHRGPAIRTPFAKSKTFSGSGIPCVYYIYIHNYNYIYMYIIFVDPFSFSSVGYISGHQWCWHLNGTALAGPSATGSSSAQAKSFRSKLWRPCTPPSPQRQWWKRLVSWSEPWKIPLSHPIILVGKLWLSLLYPIMWLIQ